MRRLLLLWKRGRGDLRLLWFALRHPDKPVWLIPATALLGFYALEPANFALPLFGIVDELVVLPLLLHTLTKALPASLLGDFGRRRA
jgi:uncharacterized membrane protein YkvA (DUF1232 family)